MSAYDRLARWYDTLSERHEGPLRDAGLALLAAVPGERVLELGPGTGHALLAVSRAVGPAGRAVGVDRSTGMLAVARARLAAAGARAGLVRGDARRLPLPDGAFDATFACFTVELSDDAGIAAVLGEVRRVSRPGARLVVVTMADGDGPTVVRRAYDLARAWFPAVVDCRPIDAAAHLAAAGFRIEATRALTVAGLPVAAIRAAPA